MHYRKLSFTGLGLAKEQIQRLNAHRWVRNFYHPPAEPSGDTAAT
jgi:hypothetical protein